MNYKDIQNMYNHFINQIKNNNIQYIQAFLVNSPFDYAKNELVYIPLYDKGSIRHVKYNP